MSITLPDPDAEFLRRLLEDVAKLKGLDGVHTGLADRAMHGLPMLAARILATETRREEDRRIRGESRTAREKRIRKEIEARDSTCTARGLFPLPKNPSGCVGGLEIDHQWGRGREEGTLENQRRLCARHHDLKTTSTPTRAFWLEHFRAHAEAHGYGEELSKCDRALALEEGQHPERLGT